MKLSKKQKDIISKDTKVTGTCFGGLLVCEYNSGDNRLKVTYHPYQFLGGGVSLSVSKLFKDGKEIFKAKKKQDVLNAYCKEYLKIRG